MESFFESVQDNADIEQGDVFKNLPFVKVNSNNIIEVKVESNNIIHKQIDLVQY